MLKKKQQLNNNHYERHFFITYSDYHPPAVHQLLGCVLQPLAERQIEACRDHLRQGFLAYRLQDGICDRSVRGWSVVSCGLHQGQQLSDLDF